MNKKISSIVSAVLIMFTYTQVGGDSFNLINTRVSAKVKDSVYLDGLSLSKSDIDFLQDKVYYTAVVDKDAEEIRVRAKPKSENASVSINDNDVDKDDNYRTTISLDKGSNIIKVKVNNDSGETKTYIVNVIKGEYSKDAIYLDRLLVNGKAIDLSKDKLEYDLDVDSSVNKIEIKADPEEYTTEVMVDGGYVTKESDFTEKVDLLEGKNPIVIKLSNSKKRYEREYVLNINRSSAINATNKNDDIFLQYVKIDNKQIDLNNGQTTYDIPVNKDQEKVYFYAEPEDINYKVKLNDKVIEECDDFKDFIKLKEGKNEVKVVLQDTKNNKKNVYTFNLFRGNYIDGNFDGANKNSWVIKDGKNYYYNENGIKTVGWKYINNNWYYFNSDGVRMSGWQPINKKWYYFYDNGIMACNTTINGYKLGSDGAFID